MLAGCEVKNIVMVRVILAAVFLFSGCSVQEHPVNSSHISCSTEWYSRVDHVLHIGDAQGHGPDPGSREWRSAAEFKLKIRSKQGKPDIMSEAWCGYINARL